MVKRLAVYSLPTGANPDEFWEFHKLHTAQYMQAVGPELRKYALNRVTNVIKGEQRFFAIVEMCWDSEEAMNKAVEAAAMAKTPDGKSLSEDFAERVVDVSIYLVDEYVARGE